MSAAAWRAAGAASVRFNCPLGAAVAEQRATQFAAGLPAGATVVDLGCGRAALLALVVDAVADGRGIGIDLVVGASPHPRVGLVEGDAAGWRSPEPASGALCVGSTHVLGGWGAVWAYLAGWPSLDRVLVADVVWVDTPGADALDRFGALPAGAPGAAALAEEAGWTVTACDTSSVEEWDEFERSWGDGVRALGTAEAVAFADQRWDLYRTEHRGVLGFAWVTAQRARSATGPGW